MAVAMLVLGVLHYRELVRDPTAEPRVLAARSVEIPRVGVDRWVIDVGNRGDKDVALVGMT